MFASVAVKKWQPSSAATAGRPHLWSIIPIFICFLLWTQVCWNCPMLRSLGSGKFKRYTDWIFESLFFCNAFQLCVSLWLRWRHVSCWGHFVKGGAQKCWSGEVLKGRKITAKGLSVILDTWFGGKSFCLEWYTLQAQTLRHSFLKEIGPRQSKESMTLNWLPASGVSEQRNQTIWSLADFPMSTYSQAQLAVT